jgi:hypothetical protein
MEDLRAGSRVHGEVGQGIGHPVVRPRLVGPVPHIELVCEPSDLGVTPEQSGVLWRLMIPHLSEDERTVSHDLQILPAVGRRRLKTDQQPEILGLVVGCRGMRSAHGGAPEDPPSKYMRTIFEVVALARVESKRFTASTFSLCPSARSRCRAVVVSDRLGLHGSQLSRCSSL